MKEILPFEGPVVHLTSVSRFSPRTLPDWSLTVQGPVHVMLEPSWVQDVEKVKADQEQGGQRGLRVLRSWPASR